MDPGSHLRCRLYRLASSIAGSRRCLPPWGIAQARMERTLEDATQKAPRSEPRAPRQMLSRIKADRLNAVLATSTECSLRAFILSLWTEPLDACAAGLPLRRNVTASPLHL